MRCTTRRGTNSAAHELINAAMDDVLASNAEAIQDNDVTRTRALMLAAIEDMRTQITNDDGLLRRIIYENNTGYEVHDSLVDPREDRSYLCALADLVTDEPDDPAAYRRLLDGEDDEDDDDDDNDSDGTMSQSSDVLQLPEGYQLITADAMPEAILRSIDDVTSVVQELRNRESRVYRETLEQLSDTDTYAVFPQFSARIIETALHCRELSQEQGHAVGVVDEEDAIGGAGGGAGPSVDAGQQHDYV